MPPVRQLLLGAPFQPVRAVAASRAVLRGIGRVDGKYLTTSTFSLRRKNRTKLRPCGVTDALGKAMIAEHIPDAQFFDGDDAEAIDNTACVLMAEVVPPVADTLMDTRDDLARLFSLTAPTLLLREFALCFGEGLLFLAEEARVLDELAVGQGREGF